MHYSSQVAEKFLSSPSGNTTETSGRKWYAVHTRARHERIVAQRLQQKGLPIFLPLVTEIHRWSDRRKKVELPLFSCYLFTKLVPDSQDRLRVLCVEGVFQVVGSRGEGTPIPDEQIEAIRIVVANQLPVSSHPFLRIGQRVRVSSGALAGLEGTLMSCDGDQRFVISIEAIQRSLAVRIDGYDIELI